MNVVEMFAQALSMSLAGPNDSLMNLTDMNYRSLRRHGYVEPNSMTLTEKGCDRLTSVDHRRIDGRPPMAPRE